MIIVRRNTIIDLPDHTEHYRGDTFYGENGPRTIKCQPENDGDGFAVFYSDQDDMGYNHEWRNMPADWVKAFIVAALTRHTAPADDPTIYWYDEWINQANREVEVVKVTPTRVRIQYEMPNTGTKGAWRTQFVLGDHMYIGDGWSIPIQVK